MKNIKVTIRLSTVYNKRNQFRLNETPNWASRKPYEEPSTDPNFLSDTSTHEDQTMSR